MKRQPSRPLYAVKRQPFGSCVPKTTQLYLQAARLAPERGTDNAPVALADRDTGAIKNLARSHGVDQGVYGRHFVGEKKWGRRMQGRAPRNPKVKRRGGWGCRLAEACPQRCLVATGATRRQACRRHVFSAAGRRTQIAHACEPEPILERQDGAAKFGRTPRAPFELLVTSIRPEAAYGLNAPKPTRSNLDGVPMGTL